MDKLKNKVIIGSSAVGVISLFVAYSAPISDIWRGITALPFVCAMFSVLVQLFRDDVAHQRQKELLIQEQQYSLAASSHMANTVFDKQVEFSDKYVVLVLDAFKTLEQLQDWEIAHDFARKLTMLRLSYMCWLTSEIDKNLEVFEQKLRTLGAKSSYIKMPKSEGTNQENRDAAAQEMLDIYSAFVYVLGKNTVHPEATLQSLSVKMRAILGVEDFAYIKKLIIISTRKVSS
ncbi:MAG: hypothetical protein HGB26_02660 [Desulfobulbaceae bacterium]|nr:hypothetical protein [Desulfobulbaceae bacterium]